MENLAANTTTEEEVEYDEIVRDPVLFAKHVLGLDLWSVESEMLQSIERNQRTAVRACHGVGKTLTLAVATLWWLARYEDGIVLTTAPTFRQVSTQLWTEIHRLAARSKIPYPEFNQVDIRLRGPENFARGLSTNRAENFQGYHGANVLIIADEAPGVESGIWDAILGTMAGGRVHIVMAGNPTIPSGAFYDAFNRERSMWHCIAMDSFDTPNLKGLTIEDLLQMDTAIGGPLDQNEIPYLTSRRWVRDMYLTWWHGDEASSPSWMSRVRGEFPSQSINALFKIWWLKAASTLAFDDEQERVVAGVDVGGGEAETVVYVCQVVGWKKKILKFGAWRAIDTLDHVARFLDPYLKAGRLTSVRVDAIGIGHNFGLYLRKKGFPVELVNVGLPCDSKPELRENNPAERFANSKAQYYQNLADTFERGEVEGLVDDTTIGQLAGILYEIDSKGRIQIEPKEKAAARGVPSPDRAEALMLCLGQAPHEYAFLSLTEWQRNQGRLETTPQPQYTYHERTGAEQDRLDDLRNDLRRMAPQLGRLVKSRRWGPGTW